MFFRLTAIALAFVSVACGKSPTSPSSSGGVSVQDQLRLDCNVNKAICVDIKRYTTSGLTVQISGELNYGLRTQTDPNGANVRLRVYDGSNFKTYIVGVFNSSPVGQTNVTIIRDIPLPASNKIDFAFYLEPRDCKNGPACWNPFVFERSDSTGLFPWNQYQVRDVGGERRIQGDMPRVEGS